MLVKSCWVRLRGPANPIIQPVRLEAPRYQLSSGRVARRGPGAVRGWRASPLDGRSRKPLARARRLERALPRGVREGRARDPWVLDQPGTLRGGFSAASDGSAGLARRVSRAALFRILGRMLRAPLQVPNSPTTKQLSGRSSSPRFNTAVFPVWFRLRRVRSQSQNSAAPD